MFETEELPKPSKYDGFEIAIYIVLAFLLAMAGIAKLVM